MPNKNKKKRHSQKSNKDKRLIDETGTICNLYGCAGVKGKNAIKFKLIDTVITDSVNNINDTLLDRYEINTDEKGNPTIGEIYACTHMDEFLMRNKKIPILAACATHLTTIAKIDVFTITLYFEIDDEIKTKEEFTSREINGTYSIEITVGDDTTTIDETIDVFPGNEKIIDRLKKLSKLDETIELLPDLIEAADKKRADALREKHGYRFDFTEIPKPTICLDDLKDMSRDEIKEYVNKTIS